MVETQPAGARSVSSGDSTVASSLIRWGGPSAILGGVLLIIGSFFSYYSSIHPPLYAAGFALVLVSIAGIYLYLRRSGRVGLWGKVGFCLCVFAFVFDTILNSGILLNVWGAQWYESPLGALSFPAFFVGLVLFGVAILRSGRLPRGGAWLLIASSPAEVGVIVAMAVSGYTLPDWVWSVPAILFGLGWMWLGYGLWSESGASATGRPSHVS
jgi:hypothetical protein